MLTRMNVTADECSRPTRRSSPANTTPRAIAYRLRYGLEDWDTLMCVAGIMMVEARASGVLYTVDPARPDVNRLKVSAIWGLGEYLVSGEAQPDEFFLDKQTVAITRRLIGRKTHRLVNLPEGGTRLEEVPEAEQELPCLDDEAVLALARYGLQLEEYFQWAAGRGMGPGPPGTTLPPAIAATWAGAGQDRTGGSAPKFPGPPRVAGRRQMASSGIADGMSFGRGEPGRQRPPGMPSW